MQSEKVNIISVTSKLEGTVEFSEYTRFEGFIRGKLVGKPGSEIILGENGVVEGEIEGDVVIIDGFVRGNITATTKVVVSETGRVIGEINAPNVAIKFGAHFDGKCAMQSLSN